MLSQSNAIVAMWLIPVTFHIILPLTVLCGYSIAQLVGRGLAKKNKAGNPAIQLRSQLSSL